MIELIVSISNKFLNSILTNIVPTWSNSQITGIISLL